MKTKKTTYRARFDGHRRLAAAVIIQAVKDMQTTDCNQERQTAIDFLSGDMWPFSDVLDLPLDGRALCEYLRTMETASIEPLG
jgi:hypothetical protein